jgi:hypothetical protein
MFTVISLLGNHTRFNAQRDLFSTYNPCHHVAPHAFKWLLTWYTSCDSNRFYRIAPVFTPRMLFALPNYCVEYICLCFLFVFLWALIRYRVSSYNLYEFSVPQTDRQYKQSSHSHLKCKDCKCCIQINISGDYCTKYVFLSFWIPMGKFILD